MKNIFSLICLCVFCAFCVSCSAPLKDGVFTGRSGTDERGAYGEVTITIKDGKVQTCKFLTYQKDGKIKGEDYGKVNGVISNVDFYNKAQLAVKAMGTYAEEYARTG